MSMLLCVGLCIVLCRTIWRRVLLRRVFLHFLRVRLSSASIMWFTHEWLTPLGGWCLLNPFWWHHPFDSLQNSRSESCGATDVPPMRFIEELATACAVPIWGSVSLASLSLVPASAPLPLSSSGWLSVSSCLRLLRVYCCRGRRRSLH